MLPFILADIAPYGPENAWTAFFGDEMNIFFGGWPLVSVLCAVILLLLLKNIRAKGWKVLLQGLGLSLCFMGILFLLVILSELYYDYSFVWASIFALVPVVFIWLPLALVAKRFKVAKVWQVLLAGLLISELLFHFFPIFFSVF